MRSLNDHAVDHLSRTVTIAKPSARVTNIGSLVITKHKGMPMRRPRYRCGDDVPDVIKKKVQLLHDQEDQIAILESQLSALRDKNDLLRTDLSRYLAKHKSANPLQMQERSEANDIIYSGVLIPIQRCTAEILSLIFNLSLIKNHSRIRSLLRVCRYWHHFIMNTPTLWARIQILDAYNLFDLCSRKSQKSYIRACMERSCDLPIHVELDLSNFPNYNQYLANDFGVYLSKLAGIDFYDELFERLEDFLGDNADEYYERIAKRALRSITGSDNRYFKRWTSLWLSLPDDLDGEATHYIWRGLRESTPNLTSFDISGCPEGWIEDVWPGAGAPDLSYTKAVGISYSIPMSLLKVSPTLLRHLDICFDEDPTNLRELSSFPAIEYLKLYRSFHSSAEYERFTISLPVLRELWLYGTYGRLAPLNLDFPKLEELSFQHEGFPGAFPSLKPVRLGSYLTYLRSASDEVVTEFLQSLLTAYPETQSLTVEKKFKNASVKAIDQMKQAKGCLNLTRLILGDQSGLIEEVRTWQEVVLSDATDSTGA